VNVLSKLQCVATVDTLINTILLILALVSIPNYQKERIYDNICIIETERIYFGKHDCLLYSNQSGIDRHYFKMIIYRMPYYYTLMILFCDWTRQYFIFLFCLQTKTSSSYITIYLPSTMLTISHLALSYTY